VVGSVNWTRVEVPASRVPRISTEFLEEECQALGPWWFDQEYGCQFKESTDAVFSHDAVMGALSDDIQPLFGEGKMRYVSSREVAKRKRTC
jgi:hypothetical protein